MRAYGFVMLLIVFFSSCKKIVESADSGMTTPLWNGYTEYIIPAGNHYARGTVYRAISKSILRFNAWFDSSCIYQAHDEKNARDINKLYGVSDCNSPHQENSARFGWTWNGKAIDIYAYCYTSSKRSWKVLGSVSIGANAEMAIHLTTGKYIFEFNGKVDSIPRGCSTDRMEGYQLYPYFGGDETAPHEMKIYIKDLTNN